MKEKLILTATLIATALPVWAGDTGQPLPEPSTLGLFAAAAVNISFSFIIFLTVKILLFLA